jgi:ribonuclease D
MGLITDTAELAAFCEHLAGTEFIAVDTEFIRERTFWPKVCLIQVAGPDRAAAIDPLASGIDLEPLFRLLLDRRTLKVFHAARQDLEIFLNLLGELPAPLFDSQIAAMVCGFGEQASYETLVARLAKARIDKGSQFTDWSLRPLSRRQIDYALSDVTHLRTIYRKLADRLAASGRSEWLAEEMAALADPNAYRVDPLQAYRRIKVRTTNRRTLAVLREVAAWREREAQARDIPRTRIIRDEALLEIAHHAPRTTEELARTRGLGRKLAENAAGQELLAAVARALALPEEQCPLAEERKEVPRGVGPIADLLRVLLRMICDEEDVAQKLVASAADLDLIAALGEGANVPALHGWRRRLFGEAALKLRDGRLALAVRGRKLALVETDGQRQASC